MSNLKLCAECGKREMIYTNVKGRSGFAWKDYTNVKITTDLDLLVCQNCGVVGLMSDDVKKLDVAIEESLKTLQPKFVELDKIKKISKQTSKDYDYIFKKLTEYDKNN